MIRSEGGFWFNTCAVNGELLITLSSPHGDEINATFSEQEAKAIVLAIAEASELSSLQRRGRTAAVSKRSND